MPNYLDHLIMLPEHMRDGMQRYIEHGIPPGSFLAAVLSNDLRGAYERADYINQLVIGDYLRYLYSYAPQGCWGSPKSYHAWIEQGGLKGRGKGQAE